MEPILIRSMRALQNSLDVRGSKRAGCAHFKIRSMRAIQNSFTARASKFIRCARLKTQNVHARFKIRSMRAAPHTFGARASKYPDAKLKIRSRSALQNAFDVRASTYFVRVSQNARYEIRSMCATQNARFQTFQSKNGFLKNHTVYTKEVENRDFRAGMCSFANSAQTWSENCPVLSILVAKDFLG